MCIWWISEDAADADRYTICMAFRAGFVAFFLAVCIPSASFAATLSVSPASGTYTVGDTFVVKVIVSSPDISVNAVTGALQFSSNLFSVVSISKASSILNFWPVEPSISRSANTASFEGVSTNGFQGVAGTVVAVTLRATNSGTGSITFQNGQVLANDGNATDVTNSISGASITVRSAPEVPASISKPAPEPVKKEKNPSSVVATTTESSTPRLQPPVIASVTRTVESGSMAQVVGSSAYPGAAVRLTLRTYDGVPVFAEATVGQDGIFVLTVAHTVLPGDYVGSVVVAHDGVESASSEAFFIRFANRAFAERLMSFLNDSGLLFVLAMIIPFLLGMLSAWFIITRSRSEDAVYRVLHDIDVQVHKAFMSLRASINMFIEELESEKTHRALTPAELRFVKKMTRTIKDTEALIEREIEVTEK